jgi:hypothetical protein
MGYVETHTFYVNSPAVTGKGSRIGIFDNGVKLIFKGTSQPFFHLTRSSYMGRSPTHHMDGRRFEIKRNSHGLYGTTSMDSCQWTGDLCGSMVITVNHVAIDYQREFVSPYD